MSDFGAGVPEGKLPARRIGKRKAHAVVVNDVAGGFEDTLCKTGDSFPQGWAIFGKRRDAEDYIADRVLDGLSADDYKIITVELK